MKKFSLFAFIIMAFLFAGCEPNNPENPNNTKNPNAKIETSGATDVECFSALLHGTVNIDITNYEKVEFGIMIHTDTTKLINQKGKVIQADMLIDKKFKVLVKGLVPELTYYYYAWLKLDGIIYEMGEIKSLKTKNWSMKDGHAYVDLGLSVKWASMNVGAERQEDYGDFFAWGEVSPKSIYDWNSYKYGDKYDLTKYCNNSFDGFMGFIDRKTMLESSDDAAKVHWGGSWRMPTTEEWKELIKNCDFERTELYGVKGCRVTSTKNGYTNNSIFLPLAGYRLSDFQNGEEAECCYWSSSLDTNDPNYACYFHTTVVSTARYNQERYYGFSIRPVCP